MKEVLDSFLRGNICLIHCFREDQELRSIYLIRVFNCLCLRENQYRYTSRAPFLLYHMQTVYVKVSVNKVINFWFHTSKRVARSILNSADVQ
jgi:hypothetical protein